MSNELTTRDRSNRHVFLSCVIKNIVVGAVCISALFSDLTTGWKVFVVCFALVFLSYIEIKNDKTKGETK